jgi:hypothetical protein
MTPYGKKAYTNTERERYVKESVKVFVDFRWRVGKGKCLVRQMEGGGEIGADLKTMNRATRAAHAVCNSLNRHSRIP